MSTAIYECQEQVQFIIAGTCIYYRDISSLHVDNFTNKPVKLLEGNGISILETEGITIHNQELFLKWFFNSHIIMFVTPQILSAGQDKCMMPSHEVSQMVQLAKWCTFQLRGLRLEANIVLFF